VTELKKQDWYKQGRREGRSVLWMGKWKGKGWNGIDRDRMEQGRCAGSWALKLLSYFPLLCPFKV
jgi:hypothetical protein